MNFHVAFFLPSQTKFLANFSWSSGIPVNIGIMQRLKKCIIRSNIFGKAWKLVTDATVCSLLRQSTRHLTALQVDLSIRNLFSKQSPEKCLISSSLWHQVDPLEPHFRCTMCQSWVNISGWVFWEILCCFNQILQSSLLSRQQQPEISLSRWSYLHF